MANKAEGGGGGGGRTNFEDLTHEQMLAWLDAADKGVVKAAADRLSEAAHDIRDIAQQLKFRPERVEWEGEGFQAFVDWAASLSSATFRLADYSDEAAKWMTQASTTIGEVQSAIPRDIAGPKANLEAALKYHNDPDSAKVASEAKSTLEKKRQEAIAQMVKLGDSYDQSSREMAKLETPTFQPPPERFVPEGPSVADSGDVYRAEGGHSGSSGGGGLAYASSSSDQGGTRDTVQHAEILRPARTIGPDTPAAAMEIDSVSMLPPPATTPPATPGLPPTARPDTGGLPPVTPVAPVFGGGPSLPPQAQGGPKSQAVSRSPLMPGPASPPAQAARLPRDGITGGKPVQPSTGRPAVGIPRGTVIGNEGVHGRPPMAHGPAGMGGATGVGQGAFGGGRRLAGETGGIVGGRPQQAGAAGSRPFTPGGSGLVRGTNASGQGPGQPNGERPDYLVEDEETWQQGRRVAPPVID
ncbi:uncharacterized protein YukE [Streptomyces sp. V4I23]|uniref:hypothetical protein n=1 Tax=Streptomyces sp. V4I23 TaxID=3042282 RepID=UPI0027837757|nr:hypothetical protein [Streptomyces sp. V4I23]MDQ1010493.1 uncharacterized protein YukE [Streptomyces sp. V4I23]